MRAPFRTLAVLTSSVFLLLAASCSDPNDDAIGSACSVVVDTCHVGASRGDCIDGLGSLPADCLSCIADHGCDYATCQRSLTGCRIPAELLP